MHSIEYAINFIQIDRAINGTYRKCKEFRHMCNQVAAIKKMLNKFFDTPVLSKDDRLRPKGKWLIPFVVSVSNHERNQLVQHFLKAIVWCRASRPRLRWRGIGAAGSFCHTKAKRLQTKSVQKKTRQGRVEVARERNLSVNFQRPGPPGLHMRLIANRPLLGSKSFLSWEFQALPDDILARRRTANPTSPSPTSSMA